MATCTCNGRLCKAARQKARPTVKGIMEQALAQILAKSNAPTATLTLELGVFGSTTELTRNRQE